MKPYLNQWMGEGIHACYSSYAGKDKQEDFSLGSLGVKWNPISK
jgi:hypothetical protein